MGTARTERRGYHGYFVGERARINCEAVPVLPARLVRNLFDEQKSYLLEWRSPFGEQKIFDSVTITFHRTPHDYIDLLRHTHGPDAVVKIIWRAQPRSRGYVLSLACPGCSASKFFLYGAEWDKFSGRSNRVRFIGWLCRTCAHLRYSSEGNGLLIRGGPLSKLIGMYVPDERHERPALWLPEVSKGQQR